MVSLKGRKVYLDANTVIYAVELPQFANLKTGLLVPLDNQEFTAITSEITLVETIIGPRRAITGGVESTGTLTLTGPAGPGGLVVNLASSLKSATLPASVTVGPGKTSASFTLKTSSVRFLKAVTISANLSTSYAYTTLIINPPAVESLLLSPSSVKGGDASVGTVTITGPAPSGGYVFALYSTLAFATVPATVTIPAGSTSAKFSIKTVPAESVTDVTITATIGGATAAAILTVRP